MHLFAVAREQTTSIAATKRVLLIIPPTFVEVERVFSAPGLFFYKADDQPQLSINRPTNKDIFNFNFCFFFKFHLSVLSRHV